MDDLGGQTNYFKLNKCTHPGWRGDYTGDKHGTPFKVLDEEKKDVYSSKSTNRVICNLRY